MKIRAKLTLLIVAIVALFSAAAALYFLLVSPVDRMVRERNYLIDLSIALKDQQVAVNRLPFAQFELAGQALDAANKEVETAFRQLAKIRILVTISPKVRAAIIVIGNLAGYNDSNLIKLTSDYKTITNDAQSLFSSLDSIGPTQLYTTKFGSEKRQLQQGALYQLQLMATDLESMNDSLFASASVISKQFVIIDLDSPHQGDLGGEHRSQESARRSFERGDELDDADRVERGVHREADRDAGRADRGLGGVGEADRGGDRGAQRADRGAERDGGGGDGLGDGNALVAG
ncbi:MAG: hypothetical protein ACLQMF_17240 [Rectinemataceae bacterium]